MRAAPPIAFEWSKPNLGASKDARRGEKFKSIRHREPAHTYTPEMRKEMLARVEK